MTPANIKKGYAATGIWPFTGLAAIPASMLNAPLESQGKVEERGREAHLSSELGEALDDLSGRQRVVPDDFGKIKLYTSEEAVRVMEESIKARQAEEARKEQAAEERDQRREEKEREKEEAAKTRALEKKKREANKARAVQQKLQRKEEQ
ncbi:hypothetical protein CF326_g1366 [Tilletia indica]|nr:hypothetical protein CF326_g1366 [Tilletia indica]